MLLHNWMSVSETGTNSLWMLLYNWTHVSETEFLYILSEYDMATGDLPKSWAKVPPYVSRANDPHWGYFMVFDYSFLHHNHLTIFVDTYSVIKQTMAYPNTKLLLYFQRSGAYTSLLLRPYDLLDCKAI
jgi:hypothetical protein